jgi:hypothetical protein
MGNINNSTQSRRKATASLSRLYSNARRCNRKIRHRMCKKRNCKSHYRRCKKPPHMLTLEDLRKRTERRKRRNPNFRCRPSHHPNPGLKLLARLCNPRHLGTTRCARIIQRQPFPKLMHRKTRDKLFHLLLQRKVSSLHRAIFSSTRSSI